MLFELKKESPLGPGEDVEVKLATDTSVDGKLFLPVNARCLVMFAHGSGLCGADHKHLAGALNKLGIATLVCNLLTAKEAEFDQETSLIRTDATRLGERLVEAIIWLEGNRDLRSLNLGILADDAGASAAMIAAARLPQMVKAVVCRSGRLSAARADLLYVKAPTLLLIGERDAAAADNTEALAYFTGTKSLQIIPAIDNLLHDAEALDQVGELAGQWFISNLSAANVRNL
jgi:dienelactone hydrolase